MHLSKLPPRYRPRIAPAPATRHPSLFIICLCVSPFALLIAYTFANLV